MRAVVPLLPERNASGAARSAEQKRFHVVVPDSYRPTPAFHWYTLSGPVIDVSDFLDGLEIQQSTVVSVAGSRGNLLESLQL